MFYFFEGFGLTAIVMLIYGVPIVIVVNIAVAFIIDNLLYSRTEQSKQVIIASFLIPLVIAILFSAFSASAYGHWDFINLLELYIQMLFLISFPQLATNSYILDKPKKSRVLTSIRMSFIATIFFIIFIVIGGIIFGGSID